MRQQQYSLVVIVFKLSVKISNMQAVQMFSIKSVQRGAEVLALRRNTMIMSVRNFGDKTPKNKMKPKQDK
jgi:hypothetical protein